MIDNFDKPRGKCARIKTTICFLSFWRLFAVTFTFLLIVIVLLVFKQYTRVVLFWLEKQDNLIIFITVIILFIIVSLPISIGYIVLVVATGYLFGIKRGLFLTVCGANFGLFVAHNILKLVGHHHSIHRFTHNETAQAIMRVISGPLCFKIVCCARLTPIPFGLQNTIFALSNVKSQIYHTASLIGLFPAQFFGVYVGSTLRSMQDVLENQSISSTTYFIICIQVLFCASLMIWIGTKARKELIKAIAEADNSSISSTTNLMTKPNVYSIV